MLDKYGSKEPGIKNTEALLIRQSKTAALEIGESNKSLSATSKSNDRDRDRDSSISKYDDGSGAVPAPCSDFAQLIKRDATAEFELDRLSAAHFAYAGTHVYTSVRVCVCVTVHTSQYSPFSPVPFPYFSSLFFPPPIPSFPFFHCSSHPVSSLT